jgi:hypothetical protein
VPYLAGALDAERGLSAAVVLGTIFFMAPFNLLRHGVGEIIGDAGRSTAATLPMAIAIAVTTVPFLLALAFLGGAGGTLILVLTIGVGISQAVPAIRTQRWWPAAQPLVGATLFVLTAVCGLVVGGRAVDTLPWAILGACWLWAAASLGLAAGAAGGAGTATAGAAGLAGTPLGPRATAALALAAYAGAVALVARHGALGLLAAVGVALYLALPVMVLLAGRAPGAEQAATGRAHRDQQGLDLLVGAWLTLLLLRHWGLMDYSPWAAAVLVATALTGYVLASIVMTWITTRRRRVPGTSAEALVPSVAIVVPCRNDADRLPACLAAIRSQTYADITVLVVDEGSTDGSADEAAAWLGEDAVRIAPPRPDGWGSRDWARHVGATAADTDLVLFVDADTVLAPIAARILVEQHQATGADLLSGLTRLEMRTVGERAAEPGFPLVLYGLAPVWWSALTGGRPPLLAFAAASLLLVRRDAYLAAVDPTRPSADPISGGRLDLRLARSFARAGLAVRTIDAVDLGATRHHRDVEETLDGWRRHIVPATHGGLALAVATILVEVAAFLVPLALPAVALLTDQPPALLVVACAPLALLLASRVALVVSQRHPSTTILWHPVTMLLTIVGQIAGIADHVAGHATRARDHEPPRADPRPPGPLDEGSLTPSSG